MFARDHIRVLFANRHLRYPLVLCVGLEIARVWIPRFANEIDATQKILLFYASAAAANSGPDTPAGLPAGDQAHQPHTATVGADQERF